jgi:hypothetical protein
MENRTQAHKLVIARKRPEPYVLTPQQEKFKRVCQECNIVKGISREQLIDKMKNCIPEAWRKIKEAEESNPQPHSDL